MTKKIYLIEDNEKNMKLFKAVLNKMEGIELFTDMEGDTGLEMIKSGEPDLVILDIQLPKLSGIDICKELRKLNKFKDTKIIAITAFAMKGDEDRILNAGFDGYIAKPIKITEFRQTVTELLN